MKTSYRLLTLMAAAAAAGAGADAARIVHVPMDIEGRETLRETAGGSSLSLYSRTTPENVVGAAGMALRLDGYSAYAQGDIRAGASDAAALTISMWVAPETYPVVALDTPTDEKICLAGHLGA